MPSCDTPAADIRQLITGSMVIGQRADDLLVRLEPSR